MGLEKVEVHQMRSHRRIDGQDRPRDLQSALVDVRPVEEGDAFQLRDEPEVEFLEGDRCLAACEEDEATAVVVHLDGMTVKGDLVLDGQDMVGSTVERNVRELVNGNTAV
ncbi:hypothetical protein GOB57_09295 [Sinorhizobium meliloti]|nr:hypothetical protein [Sinorhizobium meliloti]